jgi:hypothetical protein
MVKICDCFPELKQTTDVRGHMIEGAPSFAREAAA